MEVDPEQKLGLASLDSDGPGPKTKPGTGNPNPNTANRFFEVVMFLVPYVLIIITGCIIYHGWKRAP